MRRILALALILTVLPRAGAASTLDPSHPVWRTTAHADAWVAALRAARADLAPAQKGPSVAARGRIAAVGRRVLVIPVIPADARGVPRTHEQLESAWAGPGENSVRGFWEHVTLGEYAFEIRVLPWLQVPGTLQTDYPNVIDGAPSTSLSAGPRNLASDALSAAARVVEDLHAFDDDGPDGMPGSGDDDGVLDLVVVLHPFPGWETDPAPVPRAIVSMQSRLGGAAIEGTGLRADAFLVASASGPLGVWVHEFGHLMGLPDLYDLDRAALDGTPGGLGPQGGLGRWSLMASGTWGGDGTLPSGLDPWSRRALGIGEQIMVEGQARSSLPWADAQRAVTLEVHPLGDWGDEYFLVEARRPRVGGVVDADLPGVGALVYRVRPDLEANRIAARFVELLQADGRDDIGLGTNDGDATDPFDGSTGRMRMDGSTTPSSESAFPSPERTAPAFGFGRFSAGMEIVTAMAAGAALRLSAFGVGDALIGTRTWLRPGETAPLVARFASVGEVAPVNPTLDVLIHPLRSITFSPPGPWNLVQRDGAWVPAVQITMRDDGGSGTEGTAGLELLLGSDGAAGRRVALGLPVVFSDGLPPDALDGFAAGASAAGSDTTRFERLAIGSLPGPAFVGYQLVTNGFPGYANSVEATLTGPWFAFPPERELTLWTRGDTEEGIPGQVYDGATLEILVPERGWIGLEPKGPRPVWITRRSAATTRDRRGFGGDEPDWSAYRAMLPDLEVPARVRIRFASDATFAGGTWSIAGLQTAGMPSADISLATSRDGIVVATARLSGDVARVNSGFYQYRTSPADEWRAASAFFNLSGDAPFSVSLTLLPAGTRRAEIGLFSGLGDAVYRLGSVGLRSDPPVRRIPRLLNNPARGVIVFQSDDDSRPMGLRVYDLRGRLRARLTIPARTTWLEWEPRSDDGEILSSGVYFLRAEGMDSSTARFTWFR